MTLLLIRHGETPLNVARVLQPPDTPLSEQGRRQAAALARHLAARPAGHGLGGIVSSDLPRALATAQAIAEACGLPLTTTPLLHERNFGALRGRPYDSLDRDPLSDPAAPPGGESMADFAARCAQAWALVVEARRRSPGPLAVVSHGLVIRCWLEGGTLALPAGMALPERLANTSLTEAEAEPPHRVLRLNTTEHLGGVGEDGKSLVGG